MITDGTHYVGAPQYPALIDVEPTLNEHARQTAMKARAQRKSTLVTVSRSAKSEAPTVLYEATAYVALCDTGCTGITATGVDVRNTIYHGKHRIIATDPVMIRLGSLVRVTLADGTTFTAVASDTGGDIVGHRIDLLVGSESEAWAFGRQNVGIKILRNGAD